MRLLLGVLLLLSLFAAAALWQRKWTSAAHAERDLARGPASSAELPPGWSRVIVGRPSDDPAFDSSAGRDAERTSPEGPRPGGRTGPTPAPPRDGTKISPSANPVEPDATRHLVKPGESLSSICAARYGTARRELVEAVARYNGLTDSNDLREGRELRLPPEELLLARKP